MSEGWVTAAKLVAVVALVLGNAFFVASEFALVAIRRSRVEELVEQGVLGAKAVQRAVHNLDHYIAATQLGITLMSLALGWIGEPTLGHLLERVFGHSPRGATLSFIIAFAIITALHIVIGELTPKSIALQNPEKTSLVIAQPLAVFDLVFRPFIIALNSTGRVTVRLLGLQPSSDHEQLVHSAGELRLLVEASGKAGALEESEQDIIGRALDFADFVAHEVMTPRTEVVAVAAETLGHQLIKLVAQAGFSRYPVFDGSVDQVMGVLHVKDLFAALDRGTLMSLTARDLAREPLIVPDTLHIDDLLGQLRAAGVRMAVVVDEFGGTAGIVTMENIVERLLGSLRDEFERQPPADPERQPDGSLLVSGLTLISDVNEQLGLTLDEREYDTLGGYLFGRLGRLPQVGDDVEVDGCHLQVAAMDGRRVDRIRVIPSTPGERDAHEPEAEAEA